MKVKEFNFNDYRVVAVEPDEADRATHSKVNFAPDIDMITYDILKKSKVIFTHNVGKLNPDINQEGYIVDHYKATINVGQFKIAEEANLAHLFTPIKNGNFYDYEVNGVFYPTAKSAFQDVIDQETGFKNPFILLLIAETNLELGKLF